MPMNNSRPQTPESFIQELKHIQLTKTEKSEMREHLLAYAQLHPVTQKTRSIPSPFMMWRVGGVFAMLALLLVGGGISYASGNALPGQPFYQIKVSVVEPIAGALIPTTQGKAAWENVLAERRLTEASTLAAQNNLTATTSAYIEHQIAIHTTNAEKAAQKLAYEGHTDDALQVRSDLEARLSAHATLLATIGTQLESNGDASSTAQVAMLFDSVNNARIAVADSRVATEVRLLQGKPRAATTLAKSEKTTTLTKGEIAVAGIAQDREEEENMLFAKRSAMIMPMMFSASTTEPKATTTATTTTTVTATSTEGL